MHGIVDRSRSFGLRKRRKKGGASHFSVATPGTGASVSEHFTRQRLRPAPLMMKYEPPMALQLAWSAPGVPLLRRLYSPHPLRHERIVHPSGTTKGGNGRGCAVAAAAASATTSAMAKISLCIIPIIVNYYYYYARSHPQSSLLSSV